MLYLVFMQENPILIAPIVVCIEYILIRFFYRVKKFRESRCGDNRMFSLKERNQHLKSTSLFAKIILCCAGL